MCANFRWRCGSVFTNSAWYSSAPGLPVRLMIQNVALPRAKRSLFRFCSIRRSSLSFILFFLLGFLCSQIQELRESQNASAHPWLELALDQENTLPVAPAFLKLHVVKPVTHHSKYRVDKQALRPPSRSEERRVGKEGRSPWS